MLMQYYKFLDLEFEHVSVKLKSFYLKNENMFKTFWTNVSLVPIINEIPELQEMFDPLRITIKSVSFVKSTNRFSEIHRDHTVYLSRINLPVLNCELTKTKFYTTDKEPTKKLLPNGVTYLSFNAKDCVQADSFCLSQPALLKVQELHQVCSDNPNLPRVSCTIGFHEDIEHLWCT